VDDNRYGSVGAGVEQTINRGDGVSASHGAIRTLMRYRLHTGGDVVSFLHWILWWTGSSNVSGVWYGFWSGFASILERLIEVAMLAVLWYAHHNCHRRGCLMLGRHRVDGTPWCAKHHPRSTELEALRNGD